MIVRGTLYVVCVVRSGASEDCGPETVGHPGEVVTRVGLDEQVGDDEVVRELGERVLGREGERDAARAADRQDRPEREALHGHVGRDLRARDSKREKRGHHHHHHHHR